MINAHLKNYRTINAIKTNGVTHKCFLAMKFMLLVAAATTDVPYASSPVKNSPHPLKIIVATLCVLLTHDLFAIAKFVVKFSLNFAILLPHL